MDIQGDEPLINPRHIDEVIKFHLKNKKADIVVPSLKIQKTEDENIVKVVKDKNLRVIYLSRLKVPYDFKKKLHYLNKHLSIISFKPNALAKFASFKPTYLEKIEGIELLRALEIGLKIKSPNLHGDSFAVEEKKDYLKAIKYIKTDKYFKFYK